MPSQIRSYPDPPCSRPLVVTPGDIESLCARLMAHVKVIPDPKIQTDILLAQRLLRWMRQTVLTKSSISI